MKKTLFTILFIFMILASAFISFYLAWTDSLTTDEKAHIPAGYSYVNHGDFRLNPEHPPLLKSLSGFSLLVTKKVWGGNDFINKQSWTQGDQWQAGEDFIFNSKNNADRLIFIARIPTILFYLGVGLVLFFLLQNIFNKWIGLAGSSMFLFSPSIIAHSHLATTDIPITFFFLTTVVSFYFFLTLNDEKKRKWFYLTLVSLALAFLTKFSAVVLLPIMFLMIIAYSFYKSRQEIIRPGIVFKKVFLDFLKTIGLMLVLIYVIYFLVCLKYSPGTYQNLVNSSFSFTKEQGLRDFLNIFSTSIILKPIGQFLIGFLMVVFHVGGGHTAYLLGEISNKGWWYFFPIAFFFKVTIPTMILFITGIIFGFIKRKRKYIYLLVSSVFVVIVYFIISMLGSLNLGIRHLLPIFPFVFIIISIGIYEIWKLKNDWPRAIVTILFLWHVFGSFINFPSYLSYFNQFAVGKSKKDILIDSSLDWGQDLKRLKKYVDKRGIKKIKIDYFGGADSKYYFGTNYSEYYSYLGKTKGWLAVSASNIVMSEDPYSSLPHESYKWLGKYEPEKIIGDSIYVYNIK